LQVAAPESTVTFANAANSPLPIYFPLGMAAADLNEDGRPDLAVAANVRLYLFVGNGDGTFTPSAASPVSVPSPPYDDFGSPYLGPVAIGDFDHSGHLGLALGMLQNEAALILLGDGAGTLVPSSASSPTRLASRQPR
jgi:hypothetical protein